MQKFEYDQAKSESNKRKHGIDFEEARFLWDDPMLLEIPARDVDEPRSMIMGRIKGQHWAAIVTERNGSIRLISVRRARKREVEIYES
jgi:uncharacterized DUF497 family protein